MLSRGRESEFVDLRDAFGAPEDRVELVAYDFYSFGFILKRQELLT